MDRGRGDVCDSIHFFNSLLSGDALSRSPWRDSCAGETAAPAMGGPAAQVASSADSKHRCLVDPRGVGGYPNFGRSVLGGIEVDFAIRGSFCSIFKDHLTD